MKLRRAPGRQRQEEAAAAGDNNNDYDNDKCDDYNNDDDEEEKVGNWNLNVPSAADDHFLTRRMRGRGK